MAYTVAHDLTTFTAIKLLLLNIWNNVTDSSSYLGALWHGRWKIILSREVLVHHSELSSIVRISDQLDLFNRQRLVGLVKSLSLIYSTVSRETYQDLGDSKDGAMSHMQGLVQARINQLWQYLIDHILRVEGRDRCQGLCCKLSDCRLPMPQLDESQVFHQGLKVGWELRYEAGDTQIGIHTIGEREIVSFC